MKPPVVTSVQIQDTAIVCRLSLFFMKTDAIDAVFLCRMNSYVFILKTEAEVEGSFFVSSSSFQLFNCLQNQLPRLGGTHELLIDTHELLEADRSNFQPVLFCQVAWDGKSNSENGWRILTRSWPSFVKGGQLWGCVISTHVHSFLQLDSTNGWC